MEELVKRAFLHVDVLGPQVNQGHNDLVGLEGDIILPQVWESIIEPGWLITMFMWPILEPEPELRARAPGSPSPPPGHPSGAPPPPSGFMDVKSGDATGGKPAPKAKNSSASSPGNLGWMTGAPTSEPGKKTRSTPIRFGNTPESLVGAPS